MRAIAKQLKMVESTISCLVHKNLSYKTLLPHMTYMIKEWWAENSHIHVITNMCPPSFADLKFQD